MGAWTKIDKVLSDHAGTSFQIQKDESESDGIAASLFIQCAFLLMPKRLWTENLSCDYKKNSLYASAARFMKIYYEEVFDKKSSEGKDVYKFILDMAPICLKLYNDIREHQDWSFLRVGANRGVTKENGSIVKVANGWIDRKSVV